MGNREIGKGKVGRLGLKNNGFNGIIINFGINWLYNIKNSFQIQEPQTRKVSKILK